MLEYWKKIKGRGMNLQKKKGKEKGTRPEDKKIDLQVR